MTAYRGPWSRAQVEGYLADATIPLRLACRTPGGRLWQVPLWFLFRDGEFHCATSASADVVEFVAEDAHVAVDVSTNEIPYRGVRGNGQARVEPDADKALLGELLERYLGGTESPLARQLLDPDRAEVRLRIDPDRLVSWDFSERMAES